MKVIIVTKKKSKELLQVDNESLAKEKSHRVNVDEPAVKVNKLYNCEKCEINWDAKSKLNEHIQCHEERIRESIVILASSEDMTGEV